MNRRPFLLKCLVVVFPLLAVAALGGRPAFAHGFGERTELPVPLGIFLIGAAFAVALSFAVIGLFLRGNSGGSSYWRYNLFQHRWLESLVSSPFIWWPIKLFSVFLLGLVIAAGLTGDQTSSLNFAPTFVWIIWWVGLAFFTALIGNLWALVNPWKALFELAEAVFRFWRPGRNIGLNLAYPVKWGIWPALVLFLGFIWIQDAFDQSAVPNRVAVMAVFYTAVTLAGMVVFGKHRWLQHGEAFSVVFSFLAKFAPTEVRVQDPELCRVCPGQCLDEDGQCIDCYPCFEKASRREWSIRPFAMGLSNPEQVTNDKLVLVVILLASVTFDGFSATPGWVDFQSAMVNTFSGTVDFQFFDSLTLADTLGVLLFPVAFFLAFLAFSNFMSGTAGGEFGAMALARAFAYSLAPIAVAYNLAHYVNLLLIQGQLIAPLASDPFGYGWDLLGTADYQVNIGVINARILWYLSTVLIVVGHVLAVYLAHRAATRLFSGRSTALNSQYPMLMLMVTYTVVSLWIIAQPIVA